MGLLLALAGCDLPRDARGTLERARGGTLRVGVVGNGTWARPVAPASAAGIEAALVRDAAARLDARVVWEHGPAGDLLLALEEGALDLIIGGLTDDTPWKGRVGLTRPYFVERLVVAGPPASRGLDDLAGRPVVADDPLLRALVAAAGGEPVGAGEAPLRAAPEWALARREVATGVVLAERRHVLALAPGESGWLLWLDRFLREQAPQVRTLLDQEARP